MVALPLVEDDAVIRDALIRVLSERGHVVTNAVTSGHRYYWSAMLVEVADGTPLVQVTVIVTWFRVVSNDTSACAPGPRLMVSTSYPCCGLHEMRYAPPCSQAATTWPPGEVSTVPSVPAGCGLCGGAAVVTLTVGVADGTGVEWDLGRPETGPGAFTVPDADGADALAACDVALASAWLTSALVSSEAEAPVIPWPSSETASRLPPVAAPAPSSHAPTPIRIRPCTSLSMASQILRAG